MSHFTKNRQVRIGVIGCGMISATYLEVGKHFQILDFVACADINAAKAQKCSQRFQIPKVCTVEQLLADPEIDIVLNLTPPSAHGDIAKKVLLANKSIYNEKPLATDRTTALDVLALAKSRRLLVGCAPDTFLGSGLQTCRRLLDRGNIGQPVAATAFMLCHGYESWHPEPNFYYQPGGGPMLDMGPYYLTALVTLLGPAKRVTGSTRSTFSERTIMSQPHHGEKIRVRVPTHVAGVVDFVSGPIATIVTSFDVWSSGLPALEIYGTDGTLRLPDPNTFGGPVLFRPHNTTEWQEIPLDNGFAANSRGIGLVDMSYGLITRQDIRANGVLALHVVDIMQSLHESSLQNQHKELTTSCRRPEPLPPGSTERIFYD